MPRAVLVSPCLALLLLAGGGPLRAQEPTACADSVTRALGTLVGTWGVRTVFRQGEGWDTTAAESRVRRDFEGCLLREEMVGTRFGRPFHVLALWGAVGLQAPIQRSFVHSQHGLLSVFSGGVEGNALVLRDSVLLGGGTVRLEHRFEPWLADSMRYTSRRSTDGGATWTTTWYADYRRRSP